LKLIIDWGELSGDIHNQYNWINIIDNTINNITRVRTVQSYTYGYHVIPQILVSTVDETGMKPMILDFNYR